LTIEEKKAVIPSEKAECRKEGGKEVMPARQATTLAQQRYVKNHSVEDITGLSEALPDLPTR